MQNHKFPESLYLSWFQSNAERIRQETNLIGDLLLVERIKMPEKKTASGIIIADKAYNQLNAMHADVPSFYRVLLCGAGFYDDTSKEGVPLETQSGDIIQTGSISVKVYSSLPLLEAYEADTIGITRESEIQWRFKTEEAFTGLFGDFGRAIKEKIQTRQEATRNSGANG